LVQSVFAVIDKSVTLYCQQFVSGNCCHQNINVNILTVEFTHVLRLGIWSNFLLLLLFVTLTWMTP